MRRRIMILLLACAMLLLTACGTAARTPAGEAQTPQETDAVEQETSLTDEDGQNPVMNVIGHYRCERATMVVEPEGSENAKISVTWGGSAWERAEWSMSGRFDPETMSVSYTDGVKKIVSYNEDGAIASEETVYTDGTGLITFDSERWALTWQDDREQAAEGMVFVGGLPDEEPAETEADAGDPAYYDFVTAMEKSKVEEIAATVRAAYLSEDWAALSGMIRYPITIYGTELADADAFLSYMSDKTVDESDRSVLENEEDCHDMFFNGQGICLGSGQVWLLDPGYMTDAEPQLQIIALSGIVTK